MSDKISIIIPVYNSESKIKRCIDSVLNQTYINFEVIIIDDGSTDRSGQICDEYKDKDNRIKVIHRKNDGVSSARNLGILQSTGLYLIFLDSDDWIENNALEILYKSIRKEDDDIVICGCYMEFPYENNKVLNIKLDNKRYLSVESYLSRFEYYRNTGIFGFSVNKIYKSKIIKDNNILFGKYNFAEDLFFIFEVLTHCNTIKVIENTLYHYMHENPSSLSKSNKENPLNIINLINDKTINFLKDNNSYEVNELYINNGYIQSISNYILYDLINSKNRLEKLKILYSDIKLRKAIKQSNPNHIFYKIMHKLIKFNLCITTIIFLYIYKLIKKKQKKGKFNYENC